ncbi:hypothetical protein Dip510_001491 [Elusimicrobium posterum]
MYNKTMQNIKTATTTMIMGMTTMNELLAVFVL